MPAEKTVLIPPTFKLEEVEPCARAVWGLGKRAATAIKEGNCLFSKDLIEHAQSLGLDRFFDPKVEINQQTSGILYLATQLLVINGLAEFLAIGAQSFTFTFTEKGLNLRSKAHETFLSPVVRS